MAWGRFHSQEWWWRELTVWYCIVLAYVFILFSCLSFFDLIYIIQWDTIRPWLCMILWYTFLVMHVIQQHDQLQNSMLHLFSMNWEWSWLDRNVVIFHRVFIYRIVRLPSLNFFFTFLLFLPKQGSFKNKWAMTSFVQVQLLAVMYKVSKLETTINSQAPQTTLFTLTT